MVAEYVVALSSSFYHAPVSICKLMCRAASFLALRGREGSGRGDTVRENIRKTVSRHLKNYFFKIKQKIIKRYRKIK